MLQCCEFIYFCLVSFCSLFMGLAHQFVLMSGRAYRNARANIFTYLYISLTLVKDPIKSKSPHLNRAEFKVTLLFAKLLSHNFILSSITITLST